MDLLDSENYDKRGSTQENLSSLPSSFPPGYNLISAIARPGMQWTGESGILCDVHMYNAKEVHRYYTIRKSSAPRDSISGVESFRGSGIQALSDRRKLLQV